MNGSTTIQFYILVVLPNCNHAIHLQNQQTLHPQVREGQAIHHKLCFLLWWKCWCGGLVDSHASATLWHNWLPSKAVRNVLLGKLQRNSQLSSCFHCHLQGIPFPQRCTEVNQLTFKPTPLHRKVGMYRCFVRHSAPPIQRSRFEIAGNYLFFFLLFPAAPKT